MTTGLNYTVFPITQLQFSATTAGAGASIIIGQVPSVNVVTRYINRIVFDNMAIDRLTDTVTPAEWDFQTSTIKWQLFVNNPNDMASLQTFGLFGDQGSVDFAQPIQVLPRTFVTLTLLNMKPSAAPKARVALHMSGGLA